MKSEVELSIEASNALIKLDGVWSVQLFFRSLPYYAGRANNRQEDPYKAFDYVISEHLPRPKLDPVVEKQLDTHTLQLWAMSIVYIEAIIEHYLLAIIEGLSGKEKNLPRQATRLYEALRKLFQIKFEHRLLISEEMEWQLTELTETRHLWVHLAGKVDVQYLKKTQDWWKSRGLGWFETMPELGIERLLTENYVKNAIYFSKSFISQIDSALGKALANHQSDD